MLDTANLKSNLVDPAMDLFIPRLQLQSRDKIQQKKIKDKTNKNIYLSYCDEHNIKLVVSKTKKHLV